MTPTSSRPADVAASYLASFSTRDPDTIAAHVSDDFANRHTAALGAPCDGRDAYRERLPGFLGDMHELRYDVEHLVADGEQVAVFYSMSGRYQGDKPFSIRGAQRLRIVDGLISERVDYWDSKVFLDQVAEA